MHERPHKHKTSHLRPAHAFLMEYLDISPIAPFGACSLMLLPLSPQGFVCFPARPAMREKKQRQELMDSRTGRADSREFQAVSH